MAYLKILPFRGRDLHAWWRGRRTAAADPSTMLRTVPLPRCGEELEMPAAITSSGGSGTGSTTSRTGR